MDYTAGAKAAAVSAAAIMTAGFAVIGHSTLKGSTSGSVAGTCLVVAALTLISLTFIRRWVQDVQDERRTLATAVREAQDEQRRYIAAHATLVSEKGRMVRDAAAERGRIAGVLATEREAMEARFEEQCYQIKREAFRAGVEFERFGTLKPEQEATGSLIPFPERERAREHGVAGP